MGKKNKAAAKKAAPQKQEQSLKEAPPVIAGIDVGTVAVPEALVQRVEAAKNINKEQPKAPAKPVPPTTPEVTVEKAANVVANTIDTKIATAIRQKRDQIQHNINRIKLVYGIYKQSGNFPREDGMLVANRLSPIYGVQFTFDQANGLFIYWDAIAKTHRTLDILGGFGMTSIGDLVNRNKFATHFNFGVWSLNIYEPILAALNRQMMELDAIENEEILSAIGTLTKQPTELRKAIIDILKEIR